MKNKILNKLIIRVSGKDVNSLQILTSSVSSACTIEILRKNNKSIYTGCIYSINRKSFSGAIKNIQSKSKKDITDKCIRYTFNMSNVTLF